MADAPADPGEVISEEATVTAGPIPAARGGLSAAASWPHRDSARPRASRDRGPSFRPRGDARGRESWRVARRGSFHGLPGPGGESGASTLATNWEVDRCTWCAPEPRAPVAPSPALDAPGRARYWVSIGQVPPPRESAMLRSRITTDAMKIDPFFNVDLKHLRTGPPRGHDVLRN